MSLALVVCGRLGLVMAETSLGVTVVMRYADGGEAGHVATNVFDLPGSVQARAFTGQRLVL